MAHQSYEVADSYDELFANGETSYSIDDYTPGMDMDNISALNYFLEQVGVPNSAVVKHFGTQVYLEHPVYPDRQLVIDSSGGGDFFSHRYETSWAFGVDLLSR